jgi:hypothetical protein
VPALCKNKPLHGNHGGAAPSLGGLPSWCVHGIAELFHLFWIDAGETIGADPTQYFCFASREAAWGRQLVQPVAFFFGIFFGAWRLAIALGLRAWGRAGNPAAELRFIQQVDFDVAEAKRFSLHFSLFRVVAFVAHQHLQHRF